MSQAPADTIKDVYAAFGRGDIPAILETLDEGVDWRVPESLPHGGTFAGRDAVGGFFQGIGENWEGLQLELEDMVSDGRTVVATASIHGRLRSSGQETGYRSAHVWTVDNGVPVRFAEYVDAPLELPAAHAATA
jgi:uncharacterized protein